MTNFEKWKSELKPEDLVFKETDPLGNPRTYWAVWNLSGSECDSCPAQKVCERLGETCDCGRAFKTWASAQAEEDDHA